MYPTLLSETICSMVAFSRRSAHRLHGLLHTNEAVSSNFIDTVPSGFTDRFTIQYWSDAQVITGSKWSLIQLVFNTLWDTICSNRVIRDLWLGHSWDWSLTPRCHLETSSETASRFSNTTDILVKIIRWDQWRPMHTIIPQRSIPARWEIV